MRYSLILLTAALIPAGPANAQFRAREVLLDECSAGPKDVQIESKRIACYAYISAVLDTAWLHNEWGKAPITFCLPTGITPALLREDVLSYIREYPKLEQTPAAFNVILAAQAKYPCKAGE